jgi:histidine triad (HIT) family protein
MSSIFTKIIDREIPAAIVAEDDQHIAFLDVNPVAHGHCLVVPKHEVDYVFNLPDSELAKLMIFAKKVAAGLEKSVECKRIGISVIGLEVPHTHVHLVPLTKMDDINFSKNKLSAKPEELHELARKIKENIGL